MALDVSNDSKTKGKLIIWKKHGENNQRFRFREKNGTYQIISNLGATVEVPGNSSSKGVQIHASNANNTPN